MCYESLKLIRNILTNIQDYHDHFMKVVLHVVIHKLKLIWNQVVGLRMAHFKN